MSIVEDPTNPSQLIDRVKAILMRPAQTWEVIDTEPATIRGLYVGYIAPLAAIGPVCSAVGRLLFGARGGLGLVYRPPIAQTIAIALVGWVLALVGVYLFALVVEALAPRFGAEKNRMQAFKLAAYSGTASWVAGVFGLWPPLSILSILGLYSLYLIFLGLPKLMKVSNDKALIYTVCAVIAAMVVGFGVSILTGLLIWPLLILTGGLPV